MFETITKLFKKIPPQPTQDQMAAKFMLSYVLLGTGSFDKQRIIDNVMTDWHITMVDEAKDLKDAIIAKVADTVVTIKLHPQPFDDHLPDEFARYNVVWREATEVTSQHNAYIAILVKSDTEGMNEISEVISMITASILKEPDALCVYMNMGVYEPKRYIGMANHYAQNNAIPFNNVLSVNVYTNENGTTGAICAGIEKFGQWNVEIVDSDMDPIRINHILAQSCQHLLEHPDLFADGANFSIDMPNEDDPIPIKLALSLGVAISSPTFKLTAA